jgi:hypothetical protein
LKGGVAVRKIVIYFVAFLLVVGMSATQAVAKNVDLELSLVVDVSGSVDAADFALQRDGYVNAFRDSAIINGIVSGGTYHSIAVNLVYFSDGATQSIGWTEINSSATANAFADAIAAAARPNSIGSGTGVVNALSYAFPLFNGNDFDGTRLVIDVSGDGSESNACSSSNSVCLALQTARDNALAAGITTINGLAIYDRDFYGGPGKIIEAIPYLQDNVIGGTNAFAIAANDFAAFDSAVRDKLSREIIGTPEPLTMLLLGLGLTGLAGLRRRFEK